MLIRDLVEKDLRLEERNLTQLRDLKIESYDDMLIVRSESKSTDSCVIFYYSTEIKKPIADRPAEGAVIINLEKGRKNDVLLNFLNNTYKNSKCLDMADLCIRFNQEAHFINIEVCPIQNNGDLFRLCVTGINQILELLNIKKFFTPQVFQFVGISKKIICDPTEYESSNSDWQMTTVMKSSREMLLIEKTGQGISKEVIAAVVEEAMGKMKIKNY